MLNEENGDVITLSALAVDMTLQTKNGMNRMKRFVGSMLILYAPRHFEFGVYRHLVAPSHLIYNEIPKSMLYLLTVP